MSFPARRVTALRILCELRLDREDLHNVVEHALHPPKKTKAERKAIAAAEKAGRRLDPEPQMPTMEQMRREPLALDSSGLMYWYLDYHNTTGAPRMPPHTAPDTEKVKPKAGLAGRRCHGHAPGSFCATDADCRINCEESFAWVLCVTAKSSSMGPAADLKPHKHASAAVFSSIP